MLDALLAAHRLELLNTLRIESMWGRGGRPMMVPQSEHIASNPTPEGDDVVFINGKSPDRWVRIAYGILGCAAILALITVMLPGVGSRASSKRANCMFNLRQIYLAMQNYHDVYGCLPPAYTTDRNGRPTHSWRVLLLPFLAREDLYAQYDLDEPWDSPKNMLVFRQMPDFFRCPASGDETGLSQYVVIIGDPDKFPQTMFTPDRGITFGDVRDGTSRTILVAEVRNGVPWTMPGGDLNFDQMTFRINGSPASISSRHVGVAQIVLADGSVHQVENDLDSQTLRNLIQPADGGVIGEY